MTHTTNHKTRTIHKARNASIATASAADHTDTYSASIKLASALALAAAALALTFTAPTARAEITQDCILEGTVDMRKAEQMGQPVYVKFRKAESGPDANCAMARRNKSRRVTFVSSPDMNMAEGAVHGEKVRYRYIERDNQPGTWELMASDS